MQNSADRPNVVIWPPLLPLGTILAGLALDWIAPIGLLEMLPAKLRSTIALVTLLMGGFFGIAGIRAFLGARVPVETWKPATMLMSGGIYARTRNPMYLGLGLGTIGLALVNASDWTMILLIPAAFILHYGIVMQEERYLEAKFGDDYRRYMRAVPRYGWRLRA